MRISLNPSDHASRGLITVIRHGQIAARGKPDSIGPPENGDIWSVHTADAVPIKSALEKKRIDVRVTI